MRPSWSGTVFSQARRHIIHALNLTADAGMRPSWSVPLFRRRDASPFTLSFSQDSLNDTFVLCPSFFEGATPHHSRCQSHTFSLFHTDTSQQPLFTNTPSILHALTFSFSLRSLSHFIFASFSHQSRSHFFSSFFHHVFILYQGRDLVIVFNTSNITFICFSFLHFRFYFTSISLYIQVDTLLFLPFL